MKFSVCIPTLRGHTLGAAVRSLRLQTYQDWTLTVVGQGADASLRAVTEEAAPGDPRIRYLHIEECGASLARNAAMDIADGDIWAFTDDDCEADPEWLATLATAFEDDPSVGLVGGSVIESPKERRGVSICPAVYPPDVTYDPAAMDRTPPPGWDWIGANFAIRADVARRTGPMDIHLGPGGAFPIAEDTDYKLRLEAMGIRMRSAPAAIIKHTHGRRYGLGPRRRFASNYASGNGGLAGKLTLMGDPRGREWLQQTKAEWREALHRPYLLAAKIGRIRNFVSAYNTCVREFEVVEGVLVRRSATARAAHGDKALAAQR